MTPDIFPHCKLLKEHQSGHCIAAERAVSTTQFTISSLVDLAFTYILLSSYAKKQQILPHPLLLMSNGFGTPAAAVRHENSADEPVASIDCARTHNRWGCRCC